MERTYSHPPRSYRIGEETSEKFKEICREGGFPNQDIALAALIEVYKLNQAGIAATAAGIDPATDDVSALLQRLSEVYRMAIGKAGDVKMTVEAKWADRCDRLEKRLKDAEELAGKGAARLRDERDEYKLTATKLNYQLADAQTRISELAAANDKLLATIEAMAVGGMGGGEKRRGKEGKGGGGGPAGA